MQATPWACHGVIAENRCTRRCLAVPLPRSADICIPKYIIRPQAQQQPQFPLLSGIQSRQQRSAEARRAETRAFWHARLDGAREYAAHLLAGAMSAVVSRSTVAPFERVKMEQLLHQVICCRTSRMGKEAAVYSSYQMRDCCM